MQSARWVAIGSLGFLGVTAVVGAVPMLLHPGGDPAMLPLKLLQYSPFRSFLIPGIVLLVANGLLAFFVLWMVIGRRRNYGWLTGMQGAILAGWLTVEVAMMRGVSGLHVLYGVVAVLLIAAGVGLRREEAAAG